MTLKRFALYCFGVIFALAVVGGMVSPEQPGREEVSRVEATTEAAPPEPEKPDLELLDYEAVGTAVGGEITGTIRNNTGKRYGYVQATFVLLDNDGNQVGSALANVNGLEAGRTWKFKAVAFADFDRFKLDQITGY